MRIAVLCNDRLALPALRLLIQNRLVAAVGTPHRDSEFRAVITETCRQGGVPLQMFAKKDFESALANWLQQHKPDVVLVKTFPWKIPAAYNARTWFYQFPLRATPGMERPFAFVLDDP
jgi:methionyl-tRNA formyltransferase